jgi:hypothetical protein
MSSASKINTKSWKHVVLDGVPGAARHLRILICRLGLGRWAIRIIPNESLSETLYISGVAAAARARARACACAHTHARRLMDGRRGKYFMMEALDLHLKLMAFSGHLTKKIKTSPTPRRRKCTVRVGSSVL